MSNKTLLKCTYFPECTGCSLWNNTYVQQRSDKILYLQSLLKQNYLPFEEEIEFISCGESELRHRVDFTIEFREDLKQHIFGFYNTTQELISIKQCIQLDPSLQRVYTELTQFNFFYAANPIKKGSIRLRVGPTGLKGCWLDFSNIEIKYLLEDQKLLNTILDAGFVVEIGQKGKRLRRNNGRLKLGDATPEFWFKTIGYSKGSEKQIFNLNSLICDFTQPSWRTAESICKVISDWVHVYSNRNKQINSVLEFGAGIGQFTLGFLAQGLTLDACEINTHAAQQLKTNAKLYNLADKLTILTGDYHKNPLPKNKLYDLALVNPARSGLKNFADELLKTNAEYLVYVSCFAETMLNDLVKLAKNYSLCEIKIIDQFPQTKHFETCVLLKKSL